MKQPRFRQVLPQKHQVQERERQIARPKRVYAPQTQMGGPGSSQATGAREPVVWQEHSLFFYHVSMGRTNPEPLPPNEREQVIAELDRYLASEITLEDACHKARKHTRVKWLREMLSELSDYEQPDLPYAAKDSCWHPQWAEAATRRSILFLHAKRIYNDGSGPVARILGWFYGLSFLAGIVSFIIAVSLNDRYEGQAWAEHLGDWVFVVMLVLLAPLILAGIASQFLSGIHIFRVRVLRQDLRGKVEADIWPYLDRNEYEKDLHADEGLGTPDRD